MKKLIFLLMAGHSLSAIAQDNPNNSYKRDKDLSRVVIDINALGGIYDQKMDIALTAPNYLNGINVAPGKIGFKKGSALGGDIQLGVFLGKNKHWGLGTGLLYLRETGTVTLDGFHAEYQSVDNNGFTFRQVVTSTGINEKLEIDNFNIPLVLKYKNRFSKHWGFTADAGALFNVQMKNAYTTDASFDYEAIYKFVTNDGGGVTPIYETAITPADNDFLITKSHYTKNNPTGNVNDYFNTKRNAGYNVGLDVNPTQQKGTVTYATGSIGLLVQPSINYFFSDKVALNVGGYYLCQPFKNEGTGNYTMTGNPGTYNSVLNSASKIQTQSYGGNIGLRFFLGKSAPAMNITNAERYNPTACGLCDGSIALQGLKAGEKATVSYTLNGAPVANGYNGVVNKEGTITVPDLCAGSYTDIKATIGRKSATSKPVDLVAPALIINRVASTDPTAVGVCDGTLSLYGLRAGQKATLTYTLNGVERIYTNTVSSDNSLKLSGLCEGTITKMMVESNKCTAAVNNPSSVVLTAPTPIVYTPPVEIEDTMTQVLFDFGKSTLRHSSYAVIDRVYDELQKDKDAYVIIDGNTDYVGTEEYNQALSERRAAAVKTYLMTKGISESRIQEKAHGENDPIATNSTIEGRSKNRRAELLIKIR
jgi:outer membrane protein OmpA-like peptidoglycan-associated protein